MKFYKRDWSEDRDIQRIIVDEVDGAVYSYNNTTALEQKVNKLTELLGMVVSNMPEDFQKTIATELGYYVQ